LYKQITPGALTTRLGCSYRQSVPLGRVHVVREALEGGEALRADTELSVVAAVLRKTVAAAIGQVMVPMVAAGLVTGACLHCLSRAPHSIPH
jgi:hypothetical protein